MNHDEIVKIITENQKLLRKNIEISRKNSEYIKKIQRNLRRNTIARFIYWGIVIAIALGAFYFIRPYAQIVVDTYNQTKEIMNKPQSIFNEFFKSFGNSEE